MAAKVAMAMMVVALGDMVRVAMVVAAKVEVKAWAAAAWVVEVVGMMVVVAVAMKAAVAEATAAVGEARWVARQARGIARTPCNCRKTRI